MKTSKFKTNAKCDGCVARIADKLNEIVPREQWNIDNGSGVDRYGGCSR